jgi:hypothetical protein
LPGRIESIKNPFIIPSYPPFIKGGLRGIIDFDVNINTEKVNEKNPLKILKYPIKKACPLY